jgi:hypothetical protein
MQMELCSDDLRVITPETSHPNEVREKSWREKLRSWPKADGHFDKIRGC